VKPAVERGELYGTWTYLCTERIFGHVTAYHIHTAMSLCSEAFVLAVNLLMPNVNYSVRTALLTSKVAFYIFIQQIYVPNILNMVYTLSFFLFKMQFVS